MITDDHLRVYPAGHAKTLGEMRSRIAELEAELAEARKDGERLEWAWACPEAFTMARLTCPPNLTGRQQIDAARGAK